MGMPIKFIPDYYLCPKLQNQMKYKSINISDYNYELQDDKIAKYPLKYRDESKLLIYDKGNINDQKFNEIIDFFNEEDLLVFNNTKVIQARLIFFKTTGAKIEIFCLEPHSPNEYSLIFQSNESCKWKCIIGNKKKWKHGSLSSIVTIGKENITLTATLNEELNDTSLVEFTWNNDNVTFGELIEEMGKTPIPPYLNRASEKSDKERYQTVYSEHKGSVAAPTAGLHFTKNILRKFHEKNVQLDHITLHVGAGTFKPVKSETIGGHEMHTEQFSISKDLLNNLIDHYGKITATGTTTVRTLESIYWMGVKYIKNNKFDSHISQWDPYNLPKNIDPLESINTLVTYMDANNINHIHAETQIIIVPSYKFKIINRMITNFHQPKSTLLLLIAAFIGENWKQVYNYAINNNFRFLSYGDSSILIP